MLRTVVRKIKRTVPFMLTLAMGVAVPFATVSAKESEVDNASSESVTEEVVASSNGKGNSGGLSAFLGVLGDSYGVDEIDSDLMALVIDQADTLDIAFDLSPYVSEYANFAIANVGDFVNVRSEANTTSSVTGHMYDGSVCEIVEEVEAADGTWFKVVSGSVEGYVRSDFFIYGDDVLDVIEDYITTYATVNCNSLNVRETGSKDGNWVGSVVADEKLEVVVPEDDDEISEATKSSASLDGTEWIMVQYTADKVGYVCADYVTVTEEFVYARTMEEEAAIAKAKAEEEERRRKAEEEKEKGEDTTPVTPTAPTMPTGDYATTDELRAAMVDYALSFVGTKYVSGGQSLSGGTDCSGFTCYVYAAFGYSISRTPGSQCTSNGRSISSSELKPGDIVCFSYGSSCTHVAMYIGNGQIVHEANSRLGCVVSDLSFMPIIAYKNVID